MIFINHPGSLQILRVYTAYMNRPDILIFFSLFYYIRFHEKSLVYILMHAIYGILVPYQTHPHKQINTCEVGLIASHLCCLIDNDVTLTR